MIGEFGYNSYLMRLPLIVVGRISVGFLIPFFCPLFLVDGLENFLIKRRIFDKCYLDIRIFWNRRYS